MFSDMFYISQKLKWNEFEWNIIFGVNGVHTLKGKKLYINITM